jgi:hypothetical protein
MWRSLLVSGLPLLALLSVPVPGAYAHGPPPSYLGVAAATDSRTTVLAATEGLVRLGGAEPLYLCPSLWGRVLTPPVVSTDGRTLWIPGGDDLYRLELATDACAATSVPVGQPGLSVSGIVALVTTTAPRSVWGLTYTGTGSALWQIDAPGGPQQAQSFDTRFTAMAATAAGTELTLARIADGRLSLAAVDPARPTTPPRTTEIPLSQADLTPVLRPVSDDLYVVLVAPDGSQVLTRRTAPQTLSVRAESKGAVIGPVFSGGALWVSLDGNLQRAADGTAPFTTVGQTRGRVTCLFDTPEGPVACLGGDLFPIETTAASALATTPRWTVRSTREVPPAALGLSGPAADLCHADWLIFAADMAVMPTPVAAACADWAAPTDTGAGDGSSASSDSGTTSDTAPGSDASGSEAVDAPSDDTLDANEGCSLRAPTSGACGSTEGASFSRALLVTACGLWFYSRRRARKPAQ